MTTTTILRRALLCTVCAIAPIFPLAANAAAAGTDAAASNDAEEGTATGSSTKGSKGQANDAGALSSDDIIVTGTKAATEAPVTVSLTTTQPQAAVGRNMIDNALAVTADFNQIVLITPGVSITGTSNGVGLSESKVQIRGFQDGEYNVTYDSIPFSDTNNPTHHSTSFFPSNTIETVIVDRGPGNASQLGQATYGGNLNIYSRAVAEEAGGQIDASYGSFNTYVARGELQSGKIESLGGAQFMVTAQYLNSDGALTFSPTSSRNIFAKAVIPIGASNTLTLLSTYNRNFYYQSDTGVGNCGNITGENCLTSSTIGLYGKDYGLIGDPTIRSITGSPIGLGTTTQQLTYTQNYYKYNRTDKTTDFTIIRLQSDLGGGFTINNRLYMYGYTNNTLSGQDASGRTANTVVTGFVTRAAPVTAAAPSGFITTAVTAVGVPGYDKGNKYRNLGYIGQLNYEFSRGSAHVGGWYESSDTGRRLLNLDMTTGLPNFREAFNNGNGSAAQLLLPSTAIANVRYLQNSKWQQYQLFGEFEYELLDGLRITPGVKYMHFTRSINASVNQTSRATIKERATWTKTLPFLTANYAIKDNWSAYFQYAQGMYVPDLSSFYAPYSTPAQQATLATSLAQLKPQTTTNYQLGTVYHGSRVTFDADVYLINVDNKIAANPDPAAAGTLINIGKVRYKGAEAQVTYAFPMGLTLLANASVVDARNLTTDAQIARAAKSTAAVGMFYQKNGLFVSLSQKFTGPSFANEYNFLPGDRLYRISPYSVGDFAMNYSFGKYRIGVNVSNIFNDRSITAIGTSTNVYATTPATTLPTVAVPGKGNVQSGYGQFDTFSFNPPVSVTVSLRVKF